MKANSANYILYDQIVQNFKYHPTPKTAGPRLSGPVTHLQTVTDRDVFGVRVITL